MNDVIRSLWVGDRLTTLERICAQSWIYHGHQFELYVYNDVGNVPDGVVLKDASAIIPEKDVFLWRGSYAIFADLFRWTLLYERGGYWVDMDMLCLKPFDFGDEVLFGREHSNAASIGVLKLPEKHPVAREMLALARDPNRIIGNERFKVKLRKYLRKYLLLGSQAGLRWGEAGGPRAFTWVLKKHGYFELGKPFTCFYPVDPLNWRCLFDGTLGREQSFYASTYAVHLWNELLRREGFCKEGPFHPDSFVAGQQERLGI
ncbi:MAG: glycosyltransferase [Thiogranum sp.]